MSKKKKLLIISASTVLVIAVGALSTWGFIVYCNRVIGNYGEFCCSEVEKLPERDVALLLGAAKIAPSGKPNAFFQNRIEAAAKLYHAGKIRHIIISGDNSRKSYNEPQDMKDALMEKGVPETAMTLDYAGFRTLDSVVRCKEIFSCSRITVISQRFHVERALYIAAKCGIDAIGFAADDTPWKWLNERNWRREKYARTAAWLDLNILKRSPRFLGEKISLPLHSTAQADGKIAQ